MTWEILRCAQDDPLSKAIVALSKAIVALSKAIVALSKAIVALSKAVVALSKAVVALSKRLVPGAFHVFYSGESMFFISSRVARHRARFFTFATADRRS